MYGSSVRQRKRRLLMKLIRCLCKQHAHLIYAYIVSSFAHADGYLSYYDANLRNITLIYASSYFSSNKNRTLTQMLLTALIITRNQGRLAPPPEIFKSARTKIVLLLSVNLEKLVSVKSSSLAHAALFPFFQ